MKKLKSIISYFALILISFTCVSWGKYGHQLVGDVAKVYVNKSVLDSVQKYLGNMSWADASTWMDEIRSDHFYDYLKHTHYINVDEGQSYVKTNDDNIINELKKEKLLSLKVKQPPSRKDYLV